MTRRRDKRIIPLCSGIFVAIFAFIFLINRNDVENADAADLSKFDPGNIISDYTMSNYNSMTEAEIQKFLTEKNPCNNRDKKSYESLTAQYPNITWHWKDGHFVCVSEELFGDGMVIGEGKTAAKIIYETAQKYKINPQVLIVLIEKESGVITDSFPNSLNYRTMTGFGCPDTAPCDSKYFGFKNQLEKAAALFREVLDGGWTNYPLGENYIQYNPDRNCGGSIVNIKNLATSSLYRYTPYQPNAATLSAGRGTAYCGAYGNRNFYSYFYDWFGDPTVYENVEIMQKVNTKIEKIKNKKEQVVGDKISKTTRIGETEDFYVLYSNGVFYIRPQGEAFFVETGSIRDLYRSYGLESGKMGFPISDLQCGLKDGYCYQLFEKAVVYYNNKLNNAQAVLDGDIRDVYRKNGLENGLGYPISEEKDGAQKFEKGVIYDGKVFSDAIYEKYKANNKTFGTPVNDSSCGLKDNGCYQIFTNGVVYSSKNGAYLVSNEKMVEFRKRDRENGLGYPISEEKDGAQKFEKGTI